MRWMVAGLNAVLVWIAPATRVAQAADMPEPRALKKAIDDSADAVATARSAKQACPAAKTAVKSAMKVLRPHAKAMRIAYVKAEERMKGVYRQFAGHFNEALTLAAYHKVTVREAYIAYARRIGFGRLDSLIPVSPHWRWDFPEDEDQHCVTITQARRSGGVLAQIEVHRYKWNTIYSGVGGENAEKLADVLCEIDDDIARDDGDKCSRVKVKKFSRNFKRSHFYKVTYKDPAPGKPAVREEYYVKGRTATFNFQITYHQPKMKEPDAFTLWQSKTRPESRWMLDSIKIRDR